uniref:Villin like n=1 Tax=Myripristis murdjan TaxID=586833 RepID=A0A667ZSN4_9TELE
MCYVQSLVLIANPPSHTFSLFFNLSLSGLLHCGSGRLLCDGVERQEGLQGGAAGCSDPQYMHIRDKGFIKAKSYPPNTKVEVMTEGGESAMFKHLFKSWREKGQTQGLGTTYTNVSPVKFDVMELHARPEVAAKQRMVDDASGDVLVWRIENLELAEVSRSTYGQFYGGDCYLVLYTYVKSHQQQYILYMWQGRHATQDEITACAYQAVNVDGKYNGAPVQVRVVMGKEPRHFLAIFKGKLIIFEGGTGRRGVVNPERGARLFQVRGTDELNTKATEVPARASSLNTNDVFLLKTDHMCYLWYGKGCSGDERVMGRAMSDVLSKQDKKVVMEGQEPTEFWIALGGKAPYANDKRLQREEPLHSPRLFECSNQTGCFRMTEVDDFAQSDLDEEDVMLLDTWEEIYLWIGKSANHSETKDAHDYALEYLRTHPAGRDLDTPIFTVKQGYEPPTFTGWFYAWDPHKHHKESLSPWVHSPTSPLNQRAQSSLSVTLSPPFVITSSPSAGGTMSPPAGGFNHYLDPEVLVNKSPSQLPYGVDASQREVGSIMDLAQILTDSLAQFGYQ